MARNGAGPVPGLAFRKGRRICLLTPIRMLIVFLLQAYGKCVEIPQDCASFLKPTHQEDSLQVAAFFPACAPISIPPVCS